MSMRAKRMLLNQWYVAAFNMLTPYHNPGSRSQTIQLLEAQAVVQRKYHANHVSRLCDLGS